MIRVAFVIGDYPPDQLKLREDAAKAYSSADVEVGILRVPARPFDGLGPAEIQAAAPIFHEAFRQAEREGYDAVVPLGMLDIGVDGGRSAVDIPVIAPLQAVLHVASLSATASAWSATTPRRSRGIARNAWPTAWSLGRRPPRLGLLYAAHRRQQGPDDRIVPDGGARPDRQGRRRRDHPAGHHPMPGADEAAMARRQLGVPVVEGIGAPIRMAALMAGLGLPHSRVRWQKEGSQPRRRQPLARPPGFRVDGRRRRSANKQRNAKGVP